MTDVERTLAGLDYLIEMVGGTSMILSALFYVFWSTGVWFTIIGFCFVIGIALNIAGVYINYLATNKFLE